MKILGRILIISFVFTLFAGLMIFAVNASGMNAPDFRGDDAGRPAFRPPGDADGGLSFSPEGGREQRDEGGGSRFMFGMIKSVVVIALSVLVIVWPKNIAKRRKRLPQQI